MVTSTPTRTRVTVPEGELDGVRVTRFAVAKDDLSNMLEAIRTGRSTRPGEYTALHVDGRLWMSDTDAEYRDHLDMIWRMRRPHVRRVLINGLGLGMVVQAAIDQPHIEHIDVVEIEPRVVALVGPHYTRDPRVTIHTADAYTIQWPPGTRWDLAWHDIWPDMMADNLPEMTKLHRKYGRRVSWQGSWGREQIKRHVRKYGW